MKKVELFFCIIAVVCGITACGMSNSVNQINPDKYVTLPDYKSIILNNSMQEASSIDYDALIKQDLMNYIDAYGLCEYETLSDNTIQDNSVVEVEYTGTIDGNIVESTFEEGMFVDMASNSSIYAEGFKEGLLGKKVGETVILKLKTSINLLDDSMSEKDITYLVTIKRIVKKVYPELNDELIKKLNITDVNTYDEYVDYYKNSMGQLLQNQESSMREMMMWNMVYEQCEIADPPQELIDEKYKEVLDNYMFFSEDSETAKLKAAASLGCSEEQFEYLLKEQALEQAKEELVYMAIAKAENIKLTQTDNESDKSKERHKLVLELLKEYSER